MGDTPKQATVKSSFSAIWQESRKAFSTYPQAILALALVMIVLSSGDLIEVIPPFAPLADNPLFPFFHEIHDLLAVAVVLWAGYRFAPIVGTLAILLFFAAHIPYAWLEFRSEPAELLRILFVGLVALLGFRLEAELHTARQVIERQLREIKAAAELNARVLNERIQFLEKAARREERLVRLYQMIDLASRAQVPLEMARRFLPLLQEEVGAEYASLTLVNPDGTLGERVDNFRGIEPFSVSPRPGGLSEEILKTGQSQYIGDTETDPRANPALAQAGMRSYLGLPLQAHERVAGILFLHSTRSQAFQEEQEFLESVAQVFASSLSRAALFARLEKGKREWEMLIDAISDGVVMIDGERKIIRANKAFARMVGKPVQELIGKKVCPLLHGREEPIPDCPLEWATVFGKPQALEWREPHLGNKLLDIYVFPVPTVEGKPDRFVELFRVKEEQPLS